MNNKRIAVMQMIDSLDAGGAETVAVNIANHLPANSFTSHLCVTRKDGPLGQKIDIKVNVLKLHRKHAADFIALYELHKYIKNNAIGIIHAHSSSLIIASAVGLFQRKVKIIWHCHYGHYAINKRLSLPYRLALRMTCAAIMVNQQLADWLTEIVHYSKKSVFIVRNFVVLKGTGQELKHLPGKNGERIVCVANLRPEKDHLTLLRAMKIVVQTNSKSHLFLVGSTDNDVYRGYIEAEVRRLNIESNVSLLGNCNDVSSILFQCDIGVLSSLSEGLPLALLEYGVSGMPVVTTDVGACGEVLDRGKCGILVPPSSPMELAIGIQRLLESRELRVRLGDSLKKRVISEYSLESAIEKISNLYYRVLGL
jgi:glycosyltransferase involved in cell wall biosynthesis